MKNLAGRLSKLPRKIWHGLRFGLRTKLLVIFLVVKVIPLIILTAIALSQFVALGSALRSIAVGDSSVALHNSATNNIERMTTDVAKAVAAFLYERDGDIRYLSGLTPSEELYEQFVTTQVGRIVRRGEWRLNSDGTEWVPSDPDTPSAGGGASTNDENTSDGQFNYRPPVNFVYDYIPLYDEITFVSTTGEELVKVVTNATKTHYKLSQKKRNISKRENTYVKAETYFEDLKTLQPGQIYVSEVIGAYVGSNYIGMYTPENVSVASELYGYDIEYNETEQAYAGMENPNGRRFEGIIRWATPVTSETGEIIGYVTFALNHDHIMEFVDHITPMEERYTELPSAYEGNYAFIWDYKCRSIAHPRHHSIVGYDPETGEQEIPWLETSIYDAWQSSGISKWTEFVRQIPEFDEQSRTKSPAPELTQSGLVGLDGRYLNNAPQCTGWMDLTQDGGSGSFYIKWSGLNKLTTAAAIPYYTGRYAPSEENLYSQRGFGFVTIGAGLEDFTEPARTTESRLVAALGTSITNTFSQMIVTTAVIVVLVVLIALWVSSFLTDNIKTLINGFTRYRAGERQFRFNAQIKDEFGTLSDSFDDMADNIENSVSGALCITDLKYTIIYMNDVGLSIRGKTLDEVVGTCYTSGSIYPFGTSYCPITALHNKRESEVMFLESTQTFVKGTANYFYDKTGKEIGYIVESKDVTEMARERIKIEEQRMLLDTVFSSSPDLIWYKDAHGKYLAANPRFAAIAGLSPGELIGKTSEEVLPVYTAREFIDNDTLTITSGTPLYTEDRLRFSDGHVEMLDSVRTPLFDYMGVRMGLLGYARDVTTRVEIEAQLRGTQLELERTLRDANTANAHKDEFLARMSHEIRTPMNAIIGMTALVRKRLSAGILSSDDSVEISKHMQQIEASSQHLLGLLNDILDLSKIEAGKIELSEEPVSLSRLCETVSGIIRPRCDEKGIIFNSRFNVPGEDMFKTDPLRLRQVLINLLGNAVKFTPERGRIDFSVVRTEDYEGEVLVEFSVRDTGIGISSDALQNIFEPFEQENKSIAQKFGGTGLGLAISRNIVHLFGGEILVESQPGRGSEFKFCIRLARAGDGDLSETAGTSIAVDCSGKRVLIVDDVDINRIIASSMLEDTGIEIYEAADGAGAVAAFQNSQEFWFDIIFMDIRMPNMDGFEAARTIRSLDRPDASAVPIIALTANAFADDVAKVLDSGMNAHIAKPIELEKLLEILYRFISG